MEIIQGVSDLLYWRILYPKWNPIEHRLFSQISRNWAGVPPECFQGSRPYSRIHQVVGLSEMLIQ